MKRFVLLSMAVALAACGGGEPATDAADAGEMAPAAELAALGIAPRQ